MTSFAWWDTGHMAIAAIAYQNLNSETRLWVDQLVEELEEHYPDSKTFIESSAWADDLKRQGVYAYSSWHYTNIPYNPDSLALPKNAQPTVDIVWAINQARNVLESPRAVPLEKARFLAFLIHFVGDIHQPLHSTSLYSEHTPDGNRGGNDFPLNSIEHNNMHKLWDDGCGFFDKWEENDQLVRPLSPTGLTTMVKMAKSITRKYSESSLNCLQDLDPQTWALESHSLAVKYGYFGPQFVDRGGSGRAIKPNEEPSIYYKTVGREVVEKQLAVAGYRLAEMLNEIHAGL